MFEHNKIHDLSDYFLELNKRSQNGVFFYRIYGYNDKINDFILKYYEATRKNGLIIEGKIPNPNGKNLDFFTEMMGGDFKLDKFFIGQSVNRWLPRLNTNQCTVLTDSLHSALLSIKNLGKNENVIRNTYIKFMCWLYYKFEGVVGRIGSNDVPKILYEGNIGIYDLYMLNVLSHSGCDIVVLQYDNGNEYNSLDPRAMLSDKLEMPDINNFPEGYSLENIEAAIREKSEQEKIYGIRPNVIACTNAWLTGEIFDDIKKAPVTRGNDPKLFYNAFCRMYGVENKVCFQNDLYKFYLEMKNSGRGLCIIENSIPLPTPVEVSSLGRGNYTTQNEMLADLASKIRFPQNSELQRLMIKAFVDVMFEETKKIDVGLNKLTNRAVYILCWLYRYMRPLFNNWTMPFVSAFVFLGGCHTEFEIMFCKLLSKLPCDVLILVPNLNTKCMLEDDLLFEMKYDQSLNMTTFPTENSGMQIATAAYHAERELDETLYSGTGLYRSYQYNKANTVTLKTMYEEIAILWEQESRFRPNFSTYEDTVTVPVIFAKVSGVKDSNVNKYWQSIKDLLTEDTFLISNVPYINPNTPNPLKYNSANFFRNGQIQRNIIMNDRYYRYGVLRMETQNYILDKLQLLIDSRLIAGTFVNGTEYNIVATVLNLQTELIRLIQKFDFTKTNPKLIYINPSENPITQEDAIVVSFLNLVGFDVVFFVPTGYQTVERHFSKNILDEHQIGEYMYGLQTPRMKIPPPKPAKGKNNSIFRNIFKKGK